jgi:hypothetical protein
VEPALFLSLLLLLLQPPYPVRDTRNTSTPSTDTMHRSAVLLLTLLALFSPSLVHAAVFRSPNVKNLSSKTFKKTVQGSDKLTVAAFVAPWFVALFPLFFAFSLTVFPLVGADIARSSPLSLTASRTA